jgi:oxazoline/thiazoline dehydrogenase
MTSASISGDIGLRRIDLGEAAEASLALSLGPHGAEIGQRLNASAVTLGQLEAEQSIALAEMYLALQRLWAAGALALRAPASDPDIEITPATTGEILDIGFGAPGASWKISRFAYLHADEAGGSVVETAGTPVLTRILKPRVAALVSALSRPRSFDELDAQLEWPEGRRALPSILALLHAAGVALVCDTEGLTAEDRRDDLRQWEFHDLIFHTSSRLGRHNRAMGADFRFSGRIPSQPVVKPNPWVRTAIPLPRPNLAAVAAADAPFTTVLELRRSNRSHNLARPITRAQIGEFLFRAARNRYSYTTEIGEFTSRPYPSGGASYELELYLSVNNCQGLARGFYYYDPEAHTLSLVRGPNADLEGLLDDAWISAARLCRPQVLITVASRFQRVSWKYSGIAYAAQLKNVGALYQTFYLVATAMNLAGCGLGLGNSVRFSRLAGSEYTRESSIGEFMIGAPA